MKSLPKAVSSRAAVLLAFVCAFAGGCRSWRSNDAPAITFAKVPMAIVGGTGKIGEIDGRVAGARDGQQIVMYTRSWGLWWVQPFANQPFTKIQNGSTWSGQIHL